jgi:hypothetical protein
MRAFRAVILFACLALGLIGGLQARAQVPADVDAVVLVEVKKKGAIKILKIEVLNKDLSARQIRNTIRKARLPEHPEGAQVALHIRMDGQPQRLTPLPPYWPKRTDPIPPHHEPRSRL